MKLEKISDILRTRDDLTQIEADLAVYELFELLDECLENGDDPSEVIESEIGLEPNYLDEYYQSRGGFRV